MLQAAIDRRKQPNIAIINHQIHVKLEAYYQRIAEQSRALEEAGEVLSHLVPLDMVQKNQKNLQGPL